MWYRVLEKYFEHFMYSCPNCNKPERVKVECSEPPRESEFCGRSYPYNPEFSHIKHRPMYKATFHCGHRLFIRDICIDLKTGGITLDFGFGEGVRVEKKEDEKVSVKGLEKRYLDDLAVLTRMIKNVDSGDYLCLREGIAQVRIQLFIVEQGMSKYEAELIKALKGDVTS